MASAETFNPDVPEINPQNYMYWSRPIQGFQGNKAAGTLLTGLGQDLSEGIKDVNLGVERNISDEVDRGITAIRDQYKQDLQTVYQDVSGNRYDILPASGEGTPPKDLSDQIDRKFQTLQAAKKSGKYSDTYLDAQYDSYLKDIRSKYPGYREYIDETASKSLGRGVPANREVRSLMSDINSYGAALQQRKDAIDNRVAQAAADGSPEAYSMYQNKDNVPESEKVKFLNRNATQQARVANLQTIRNSPDNDQGMRTSAAYAEANQRVSDSVNNFVHTFSMGGATPEAVIRSIEDPNTKPEVKAQQMNQLQTAMQVFRQSQVKAFNQIDPKTGRSLDQDLGGRGQDIIDKQIAFYSSFQRWMHDGNGGPIAATVAHAQAADNDPNASLLKTDAHAYTDVLNTIMRQNPEGNKYLSKVALENTGQTPTMKAAADERRLSLASGSNQTINDVIKSANQGGINSEKIGDANSRSFYNNVVSWYTDLFDKTHPGVQMNMAKAMFGPGNERVMDNFNVGDQANVFNRWFSPGVDREMFTHIAKGDNNLAESYAQNKKSAFNTVMTGELAHLDATSPNGLWSYDNSTHQIKPHGDVTPAVHMAANRMNVALASMDSMAKYTKEDPAGLLLDLLQTRKGPVTDAIENAAMASYHQPKIEKPETEKDKAKA